MDQSKAARGIVKTDKAPPTEEQRLVGMGQLSGNQDNFRAKMVFGFPSLELRTVLKILQEYDPLAQKVIFECTSVAKQPQADQGDKPS